MGVGIAYVFAAVGCSTTVVEPDGGRAAALREVLVQQTDQGRQRGKLTDHAAAELPTRVTVVAAVTALPEGLDLVVESVPERRELKLAVLADIPEKNPAILATGTSALSVDELGRALPDPARFLGLHFFNPVWSLALVEVVKGAKTSDETLGAALDVVALLGKQSIVVGDTPGFATSRLDLIASLEAMRMLEQGVASAEDIDTAMTVAYRHPRGPLRLSDVVGLDVRLDIARHLEQVYGERYAPPQILSELRLSDSPVVSSNDERRALRESVGRLVSTYGRRYFQEKAKSGGFTEELWRDLGEFGGGGGGLADLAVVIEECAAHGCPMQYIVGVRHHRARRRHEHPQGLHDRDAGRGRWLAHQRREVLTSGADEADAILVVCKDAEPGPNGRDTLSLLVVDAHAPGLTMNVIDSALGAPEKQFMLFFDDVPVAADSMIGAQGSGLKQVFRAAPGHARLPRTRRHLVARRCARGPKLGPVELAAHRLRRRADDRDPAASRHRRPELCVPRGLRHDRNRRHGGGAAASGPRSGGPRSHLLRSVGRPHAWVELAVKDPFTGLDAPAGEVGEILIRSGQNVPGYWNQPEASAQAFVEGGWLRTGDGAHLDDDGFLFLHDRLKDMIISGGENVYPAEVENVLAEHPRLRTSP